MMQKKVAVLCSFLITCAGIGLVGCNREVLPPLKQENTNTSISETEPTAAATEDIATPPQEAPTVISAEKPSVLS